ncbi:MAG: hypothetical protein M3Q29_15315 [Chloroflexota bacterium]|nr:hypothetical protein [Chloroflexota bacterium]
MDGPGDDFLRTIGIEPIVDLYHFGSPAWLEHGLMHPVFPEFQAEWVREFARRYEWVQWYTPTNEPYIMSSFAADFGHWYPFLRGPKNFGVALMNAAKGLCLSWEEVRNVRSDARMMVSDTHEYWHALDDASKPYAEFMNQRRFLTQDLYGGRIGEDYPMRDYLSELGFTDWDLEWFQDHPAPLDIVGVDYYPHSEHQLRADPRGAVVTPQGRLADETAEQQFGFAKLVRQYFDHF